MTAAIRNVDVDPAAPLEQWPYEALVTLIERGTITDWARVSASIRHDPWGPVARQVEDYLGYEQPIGVAALLRRAISAAREAAEAAERAHVAALVDRLVTESGLSMAEFASRIGTSRSRLSTYRSGRVVPAATMIVRMRRVSAAS